MSVALRPLPYRRGNHGYAPRPQFQWTRLDWQIFGSIGLIAFLTRFLGIQHATASGTPVFDEKHYVPQAWDIVRSNEGFFAGGIESNPGYGLVVHPPLAKQIMALSETVFGYTPLGWRLMTALCGVITVLLIMAIARRLSNSALVTTIAGILAVFDGVLLVTSRFGMLDIFQTMFIVAAALAFVHDWQRPEPAPPGIRWWRFICGVFLGCTLAVKWSGLYYMAFFGLFIVALDYVRAYQAANVWRFIKDSFASFAALVIAPVLVYLWTWRAWFASETSVYRHAASDGTIAADSPLQKLPEALAGWFYYHASVLEFHSSLTTSNGHDHPWDSKPFTWLAALRPILYYSSTGLECAGTSCRQMIYLFGTPAIWWLTVPVVVWALVALVWRRQVSYLLPLVAFMAGFIPWVMAYDRQMYFFYATPLVPFTIIMLALTCGSLAYSGRWVEHRALGVLGLQRARAGALVCIGYLAVVAANFVYFSPILYGYTIPDSWYEQLMWLPSWR